MIGDSTAIESTTSSLTGRLVVFTQFGPKRGAYWTLKVFRISDLYE